MMMNKFERIKEKYATVYSLVMPPKTIPSPSGCPEGLEPNFPGGASDGICRQTQVSEWPARRLEGRAYRIRDGGA